MFFRILFAAAMLAFVTAGARSVELPEGVEIAIENTYIFCDVLEMSGEFRGSEGKQSGRFARTRGK